MKHPLEPALKRARELGCLTSMNICWDVRGRWLKTLQPALAHTDFIFPNREEGRQLTGESEPAAIAARLRELGVKTVIVKLGAAGCYVESPQGSFTSPGFAVQPWTPPAPAIALPRDFSPHFAEANLFPSPRAMPTPPERSPRLVWVADSAPTH